ncbi:MAG TPA: hypothetical protein VMK12_05215, partial [Anaeromyxobacteraceae bacterium]|nr:hypothetical protein [Anaeromyxobacteraceae bacterium]
MSNKKGSPVTTAELAERLRGLASKIVDDFRRSDRFFKLRVGIVATWAVLSIATLWGACAT